MTKPLAAGRLFASLFLFLFFLTLAGDDGRGRHPLQGLFLFDAHAHGVVPGRGKGEDPAEQAGLAALRRGGVGAVFFALPLDDAGEGDAVAEIARDAEWVRRFLAGRARFAELAASVADMDRIRASGRIAVWLGLESFSGPLAGDVAALKRLHGLGIRMITLADGGRDRLTAFDPASPGDGPLGAFGRAVVQEMNRLGLLIDISHLGDRAQRQVIQASQAPVIASHANARGVVDLPRNLDDRVLDLLAGRNGALMVDGDSSTLHASPLPAGGRRAPLASLAGHIHYVRRRAGAARVGIGSDFGGSGSSSPRGLETAAGFPSLVALLRQGGIPEQELALILGGNLRRILSEVEAGSR